MINYFKLSKFFLYLVPFSIIIVASSTLFPFIVGKYVFFRTVVDLALIFFLLGLFFQDKLLVVSRQLLVLLKSPLVIAVSIFVFIFVLAGFFGVDPSFSFWSNFERGEGGLQMIHLWLFFILLITLFKEEKDWRKLFWFSIIGAVLMIFYGILALQGASGFIGGNSEIKGFIKNVFQDGFRFIGTIGNPAYVATYLIFVMFYTGYILIAKRNNYYFLISILIFFFAFFLLAATRGGFIGLLAAIVAGAGYFAFSYKSWQKWAFLAIVVLLITTSTMIYFKDTAFVKSIPGSRIFDISFSTLNFQSRMVMWQIAIDGFKERPILGWGPENFIQVFDKHYNIKHYDPIQGFGAWYDRAHSIYLDYLVQSGILGLLSYLAVFAVFYWQLIKKADKSQIFINVLLFALPIAYLVQGLVLFEVLPLYLNLFLFLAFATYKFKQI